MMLNIPFIKILGAIRRRKQQVIEKNNQLENKNCQLHTYSVREKVLVRDITVNKYEEPYIAKREKIIQTTIIAFNSVTTFTLFFSVDGLMGTEAEAKLKCLDSCLTTKWCQPYSSTCGYV